MHQMQPKKQVIKIEITERLRKTYTERYVAEVLAINQNPVNGKILVYTTKPFEIGTTILVNTEIKKPKTAALPGNFNYQQYLYEKSIVAQLYLTAANSTITGKNNSIAATADAIRKHILEALTQAGCSNRELQVIAALLLGQQQDIDSALMNDYRNAGAVHILSVSGLHMGFVVLFIGFILNPLPNTPIFREVKWLLTLVTLWAFAFLAGLAPSVVRSATMFSLLSTGLYLRRRSNIYHTLAASAFLILIVAPYLIFDVGFQLSYGALVFIVWLQPLFQKWYKPKSKVAGYFYDILTVSIAAQLGTLPLSLYYFHQFPGLFFITNLFIIPILSVIMTTGAIAMLPACFGVVPVWLAKTLEIQVFLMNSIIEIIAQIENALLTGIPMNIPILFCLYLSVLLIIKLCQLKTIRRLLIVLTGILLVQLSVLGTIFYYSHTAELLISNNRSSTFLLKRHGRKISLLGIGHAASVQNYAQAKFSTIYEKKPLKNHDSFLGRKIFITDSTAKLPPNAFDILVLSQNPKINLARLLEKYRPKVVVITANNYPSKQLQWKTTCSIKKIPFHAVAEKGPFIMKN